jgi:hypothetical protein
VIALDGSRGGQRGHGQPGQHHREPPRGAALLAKITLRKQHKVDEHHAQCYIVFDNAGFSLKSYRRVWLSSG